MSNRVLATLLCGALTVTAAAVTAQSTPARESTVTIERGATAVSPELRAVAATFSRGGASCNLPDVRRASVDEPAEGGWRFGLSRAASSVPYLPRSR